MLSSSGTARDRVEADLVAVRSILLQGNPRKGNFDSQHPKQIHQLEGCSTCALEATLDRQAAESRGMPLDK
jgi:hypothetical protein